MNNPAICCGVFIAHRCRYKKADARVYLIEHRLFVALGLSGGHSISLGRFRSRVADEVIKRARGG
ncbi:hypothetical protein, partial [Aeromonas hydrophila]|uniref:hypothetical protein n=1 Tax=Aeromonas hydrophila TaxID=644 RepID=UPI003F6756E5